MKKTKRVLAGHIGVDAGLCWIGDPCYVIHSRQLPDSLGKNWEEFCDIIDKSRDGDEPFRFKSFNYNMGHEGLGVLVESGYGDGEYPVYVTLSDEGAWGTRVKSVTVKFF